jgi:4-hydroxy-3-methylbut-2-enyl diphosphate reductase IspH
LKSSESCKQARADHLSFPEIIGPKKDDICYATQNRQDAVKALAIKSDVVFVVGSKSSSNSGDYSVGRGGGECDVCFAEGVAGIGSHVKTL